MEWNHCTEIYLAFSLHVDTRVMVMVRFSILLDRLDRRSTIEKSKAKNEADLLHCHISFPAF